MEQKIGLGQGLMWTKQVKERLLSLVIAFGIVAVASSCRTTTDDERRLVKAFGFAVSPTKLPFHLGDDVAAVRKALRTSSGPYQFKPELVDPMPRLDGYAFMTTQCGKPGKPQMQCGLFLFFQADGRLVSIYAAHPLDITATPQINVNWIAGFRIPLVENGK